MANALEDITRNQAPNSRHAHTMQRRAAIASLIGSVIEWYDFFIFGTAAALVFPKLFFPDAAGGSVASSFFTIFVGFLARPIGALIFGHIGDRLGRKSTLLVTLLLMSVATARSRTVHSI